MKQRTRLTIPLSDCLTKAEAVKLIFDLAPRESYDEKEPFRNYGEKARRNKINKRLTDEINRGSIHEYEDSLLSLDDILRHAIEWYGVEYFQDYPIPGVNGRLTAETQTATFSSIGIQLPDNNLEVQELAKNQYAEILRLNELVAQLEPDANQHRKNKDTYRNNAKKKRDK